MEFDNLTISGARGLAANAVINGGAINNAAALTLNNVYLTNNWANAGGAIYNATTANLTLINCNLTNNQAVSTDGGAIDSIGNSTITASGTTFSGNQAAGKGGAIAFNNQASVSLTNTNFVANSAANGGAVYASVGNAARTPLTISGGLFECNSASNDGGALYLSTTNASISGADLSKTRQRRAALSSPN